MKIIQINNSPKNDIFQTNNLPKNDFFQRNNFFERGGIWDFLYLRSFRCFRTLRSWRRHKVCLNMNFANFEEFARDYITFSKAQANCSLVNRHFYILYLQSLYKLSANIIKKIGTCELFEICEVHI